MRILHLESPNPGKEGDHVYRTRQPCRALGELPGVAVQSGSLLCPALHAELATTDVLVLCDVADPDLVAVVEARRRAGRLTVFEINDHVLAPQSWSATAYLAKNPLMRSLPSLLGARAHALQFNVPELEREFAHLLPAGQRVVFPNQLWDLPPAPTPRARDRVWLGWGGSLGHREDLAWVLPTLAAALARHPALGLSVMGPDVLLAAVRAAVPDAARVRTTPGGSLEAYYAFLADLDFGVCPLLPTDFNRCRSDVKFLELAARGLPAICSDLAPYRDVRAGETGLLFRTPDQLGAHIDRLVADPALRARLGAAAYESIRHRRERAHAPARRDRYLAWHAQLAPAPPAPAASGYHARDGGRTEVLLREGLAHAVAGFAPEAVARFREAAALAPGFYLPRLYLGAFTADPADALAALGEADRLAPGSVNVALQIALRLAAAGDPAAATRAWQACRARAPGLGVADAQLGDLCEAAGDTEAAIRHYEAATAANPYFSPPVLRLAHRALAARDHPRATALLEGALAHDPNLWRFHFLLGRVYVELTRWQAALHHLERALGATDEPAPVLALLAKTQIALGNVAGARATVGELRRIGATTQAL